MKNKGMIIIVVGLLIVGGTSLSYGANRNCTGSNNINRQMMSAQNFDSKSSYNYRPAMMGIQNGRMQSENNINNMIKIMKENGFNDQAIAMENRDFDAMNKLMTNISDEDYKKMIEIMQNNGYGSMAKMMQSVSREDMIKFHQSMMGK
jgi:hypothetical protein